MELKGVEINYGEPLIISTAYDGDIQIMRLTRVCDLDIDADELRDIIELAKLLGWEL